MKSNLYLWKQLKGQKVTVHHNKDKYEGIFFDFDIDGKFVFIKVDNGTPEGKVVQIWWPGSKLFKMEFADPLPPKDDGLERPVSPESLYEEYYND